MYTFDIFIYYFRLIGFTIMCSTMLWYVLLGRSRIGVFRQRYFDGKLVLDIGT